MRSLAVHTVSLCTLACSARGACTHAPARNLIESIAHVQMHVARNVYEFASSRQNAITVRTIGFFARKNTRRMHLHSIALHATTIRMLKQRVVRVCEQVSSALSLSNASAQHTRGACAHAITRSPTDINARAGARSAHGLCCVDTRKHIVSINWSTVHAATIQVRSRGLHASSANSRRSAARSGALKSCKRTRVRAPTPSR